MYPIIEQSSQRINPFSHDDTKQKLNQMISEIPPCPFYARVKPDTRETQSFAEHALHCVTLVNQWCDIPELKNIVTLAALFHDAGKLGPGYCANMEAVRQKGRAAVWNRLDHSSAGGRIVEDLMEEDVTSKIISTAIYSHHRVHDCVELETGRTLSEKRRGRKIAYDLIRSRFFQIFSMPDIESYMQGAREDVEKVLKRMKDVEKLQSRAKIFARDERGQHGSVDFYLGMLEKLVLSLLIDSDWTDAACFSEGKMLPRPLTDEELSAVWSVWSKPEKLLSEEMKKQAEEKQGVFLLTLPEQMSAERSMTALRFACFHAKQWKKKHIFYVVPFAAALEGLDSKVREAESIEKYVLKHRFEICHPARVAEENGQEPPDLSENYDYPIVFTTIEQVMNCLFSDDRRSLRRMHYLCDSVIIFDGVRDYPEKCMELWNLAVNFLMQFCNSSAVLCSDIPLPAIKTVVAVQNIERILTYDGDKRTKNVHFMDATREIPGGMGMEDLKEYTLKAFREYRRVLVTVNTRRCAFQLFCALQENVPANVLYHISGNVCPENKKDAWTEMTENLPDDSPLLCISTRMRKWDSIPEFDCVIRSLDGLDVIAEAAEFCTGQSIVMIVKLADGVDCLPEIRLRQKAAERFLYYFRRDAKCYGGSLGSWNSLKTYYECYSHEQELQGYRTRYVVTGNSFYAGRTDLTDILGENVLARQQYRKYYKEKPGNGLYQAFETAGQAFRATTEEEGFVVIVPYNMEAEQIIAQLRSGRMSHDRQKMFLKKLQKYAVRISESQRIRLQNHIHFLKNAEMYVLDKSCYDHRIGVMAYQ